MTPVPKNFLWGSAATATAAAAGVAGYLTISHVPDIAPPTSPPAPIAASEKTAPVADRKTELAAPQFDVVRVAPNGASVVAGRAAPNMPVILLDRGQKIAAGKTDANGQFVILPPDLPAGDHLLSLSAPGPHGDIASEQSVAAFVPKNPGEQVLAALSQPDQPTRVLNDASPLAAVAAPSGAAKTVSIQTADVAEDGAFLASGQADAGAPVRLYLNNSLVAAVVVDAQGKWSLRVEHGMTPGHYDIRADVIELGSGKVIARAEAPFDYPADTVATNASTVAKAVVTKDSQPVAGAVVVARIQSVTVEHGDSLWRISRRILGQGIRYTQIYEANAAQIRDPNKIWPGQIFVAPKPVLE